MQLLVLFLIGLSWAEGKLVSWYLDVGNYRPVGFSSVSHRITQQLKPDSINEELQHCDTTDAKLCVFMDCIL